jgi:hypothetical protein
MAEADFIAQLSYQDRVRAFHKRLRTFYYGYLFTDKALGRSDFEQAPKFDDQRRDPGPRVDKLTCRQFTKTSQ